jgi:hypothetical protein
LLRFEYKGERGVGEVSFKHLSKHFAARIQSPSIKEGRRGERRKRIITLKIALEGFLWEAAGKIHTAAIHHPPK